jgi:hypothetical protein
MITRNVAKIPRRGRRPRQKKAGNYLEVTFTELCFVVTDELFMMDMK